MAYSNRAEKMTEKVATERGVNAQLYENNSLVTSGKSSSVKVGRLFQFVMSNE